MPYPPPHWRRRTTREAMHLRAIGQCCAGRWRDAALTLEDLGSAHPLDALALQMGRHIDFLSGDAPMLRDRIARAARVVARRAGLARGAPDGRLRAGGERRRRAR